MKPFLTFVLGAVAALVGLEGLFRVLPTYTVPGRTVVGSPSVVAWNSHQDLNYSRGIYLERPTRHVTNSIGMVNGGTPDSGAGIWIYGDSFVESQMQEFRNTFQGILGQALAPNGVKVATLNASGAGLVDYVSGVRRVSESVQSPIHIVVLSLNDLTESLVYRDEAAPARNVFRVGASGALQSEHNLRPHDEGLRNLAKQSALMRYVFLNLQFRLDKLHDDGLVDRNPPKRIPPLVQPDSLFAGAAASSIDSLVAAANGHPVLFVQDCDRDELTNRYVLGQPTLTTNLEAVLAKRFAAIARSKNVPLLDLCPVFGEWMQQHHRVVDMRPVDKHWNEDAHRLVAHAIEGRLRAQGWVGDRSGD